MNIWYAVITIPSSKAEDSPRDPWLVSDNNASPRSLPRLYHRCISDRRYADTTCSVYERLMYFFYCTTSVLRNTERCVVSPDTGSHIKNESVFPQDTGRWFFERLPSHTGAQFDNKLPNSIKRALCWHTVVILCGVLSIVRVVRCKTKTIVPNMLC